MATPHDAAGHSSAVPGRRDRCIGDLGRGGQAAAWFGIKSVLPSRWKLLRVERLANSNVVRIVSREWLKWIGAGAKDARS